MTAPDKDSIQTYGGALNDYTPVIDATTDRPAAGANQAYATAAALSQTGIRAWARFTWNASTLTLVNHVEMWSSGPGNAVPTLAHTATGVSTVTWPTTVNDEILINQPGYTSPHTLALRAGWGNAQGGTNLPKITITSANVATVTLVTVADPGGVAFDVFVI